MSSQPSHSPYWQRHPTIPIYIAPSATSEAKDSPADSNSNRICPTCSTSSHDQDIHCISTTSTPAPPPYSSLTSIVNTPSRPARNLAVPVLSLETSRRLCRPLPPEPALDPANRSRVRFRRTTLSPLSPDPTNDDIEFRHNAQTGLGIKEAPFHPDPSPIKTPVIEVMEQAESDEKGRPENIAQRIEKKLWKYSASSNVVKRWLLEIISWLLSATCMSAIIIALLVRSDKPPPTWLFGLTLNAYISIFSKVASAALLLPVSEALGQLKWLWFQGDSKKMWDFELFDNASRGPWGSFLLLVRTKGKSLAALGAAVTIFAMALDPFFQQVVDYPSRIALNETMNSAIPRITSFYPDYDQEIQGGVEIALADSDMQTVILEYFNTDGTSPPLPVGEDNRPDIPLSCPTSNCTWGPYDTMALCSACEDVSDILTYGCYEEALDWISDVDFTNVTYIVTDESAFLNGTQCGWWVNATADAGDTTLRPALMTGFRKAIPELPTEEVMITRTLSLTTSLTRRPRYGMGSLRFKHIQKPLLDFFVASATDGIESIYRGDRPIMKECSLHWCVKTVKSSYFEAVFEEEVLDITLNDTIPDWPWVTTPVETPMGNGTDMRYMQDIHIEHNGVHFNVSNVTVARTIYALDDYMPSYYVQKNDSDIPLLRYKTSQERERAILRNTSYNPFLAPNDISSHMARLATALTNRMRSSDQHDWVSGLVFDNETYVHVRWVWLSLPIGLLVFTLIFLGGTIVKASISRSNVGIYKTSAIATLLFGMPDDLQKKIKESDSASTPRTKAKEMRVKMLPEKGWRLSGFPLTPQMKPQPPPGWI